MCQYSLLLNGFFIIMHEYYSSLMCKSTNEYYCTFTFMNVLLITDTSNKRVIIMKILQSNTHNYRNSSVTLNINFWIVKGLLRYRNSSVTAVCVLYTPPPLWSVCFINWDCVSADTGLVATLCNNYVTILIM